MSHSFKQGGSQQVHLRPGIAFKEFNSLISHEISKHPLPAKKNRRKEKQEDCLKSLNCFWRNFRKISKKVLIDSRNSLLFIGVCCMFINYVLNCSTREQIWALETKKNGKENWILINTCLSSHSESLTNKLNKLNTHFPTSKQRKQAACSILVEPQTKQNVGFLSIL